METSLKRTYHYGIITKYFAAILAAIAIPTAMILFEYFTRVEYANVYYESLTSQFIKILLIQFAIGIFAILPLSLLADYVLVVKLKVKGFKAFLAMIGLYILVGAVAGIAFSIFITSAAYASAIGYVMITTCVFLAFQTLLGWAVSRKKSFTSTGDSK